MPPAFRGTFKRQRHRFRIAAGIKVKRHAAELSSPRLLKAEVDDGGKLTQGLMIGVRASDGVM